MIKSVVIKLYSRYFIPAVLFLIPFSLQAQYHFEGRVLDAETELPVGSFVVQANSTEYQFTAGTFHFETSSLPVLLTFKAKGYYLFSFPVSSGTTKINIRLIPENINIQEVMVKAFQSGKRLLNTPGSIGIITNRQLLREPAFTLAPSVNKMAGVWMQSGSINTNRLTIRGIGTRSPYGSNKIRAYYGDIPLTNGVGETTLEDLDLEQIADIEIIKGPSSGFYGSGLGGVLLFNPSRPVKDQFVQQVSAGSYQTIKYTGKLTIAGQNSAHSLVYSRLHSDGYRENNETNRHNLTWTSTFTRNKTQIDLLAAFIKMDAYIPSSIDLKTFQETPEKAAANWANSKGYEDYRKAFGGISVQQTFCKNWKARLSTFGQTNQNNELRPFNILQEKNRYLGFRSVLEKKYIFGKTTSRLILGNEFFTENYQWQTLQNKNRVAGNLLTDNEELRWYNNIFILTDLNFQERFQLSASLNWNRTNYRYEDHFLTDGNQSGKHQFDPVISPRLAANWKSSEKLSLFAVVSHGFSPPTLEETLMPGGLRNTAIKPETGWNMELGAKGSAYKSLFFEVSVYYMKVKNLLVAQRTAEDEYMGINAGGTNHPGLEIKIDYQLIDRPKWSSFFRINANLTRYRFAEFVNNGNNYSGNKLTGSPVSTTNWMLETSHTKGFFLNLHYQTVGRMPMRDDNTLFTDAYQLANLMAGYEKSLRNLSVSLSSGVQNLFDTHYASMILINATAAGSQSPRYYYPGLPRNFKSMISLKYSF
jgi:iron complex outermembrane receptor protein